MNSEHEDVFGKNTESQETKPNSKTTGITVGTLLLRRSSAGPLYKSADRIALPFNGLVECGGNKSRFRPQNSHYRVVNPRIHSRKLYKSHSDLLNTISIDRKRVAAMGLRLVLALMSTILRSRAYSAYDVRLFLYHSRLEFRMEAPTAANEFFELLQKSELLTAGQVRKAIGQFDLNDQMPPEALLGHWCEIECLRHFRLSDCWKGDIAVL